MNTNRTVSVYQPRLMNYSINTSPEHAFPTVDLNDIKPAPDALDAVQPEFAIQRQVLPFACENGILYVAIGSVENLSAVDELGMVLEMPVRAVLGDPQRIRELVEEVFLEKILSDLPGNTDSGTVKIGRAHV